MRASTVLLGCLVALIGCQLAAAQGAWRVGRATYYGTDAWSIHQGSCHYNYLWPDEPLGWDVAAISDTNFAYIGSCGRCYEVRCNPSAFKDGYGEPLDRNSVCYNPKASVVVRITDTCPCVYPTNAYSNKRWCCGDMEHLDMSVWAFEKLADKKWGVIGIQYRPVPCKYTPDVIAPPPAYPSPGQAPPAGARKINRGWDWTDLGDSSMSVQWSSVPHDIYVNGLKQGWVLGANNGSTYGSSAALGIRGGANAVCTTLDGSGYLDFSSTAAKPFVGAALLELWVHKEEPFDFTPAVKLQLLSAKGPTLCRSLALTDASPAANTQTAGGWARFVIDIASNFPDTCSASTNTTFAGCTGTPAESITGLRIANILGSEQLVCLDGLRLLSNVAST